MLTMPFAVNGRAANAVDLTGRTGIEVRQQLELLIAYTPAANTQARARARTKINAKLMEQVATGYGTEGPVERVLIEAGLDGQRVADVLAADPNVRYAEPNYTVQAVSHQPTKAAEVTPAPILASVMDPYYRSGETWGMRGGNGSAADATWGAATTNPPSVFVGILDEGVQLNHEDLAGRGWTNPLDSTFDGVDDDRNGKVDDVHGWDFYNDDGTVYDGSSGSDLDTHGTQVAGVMIAAHNALGLPGVTTNNVGLVTAKFIGPTGGTTADAVQAIEYFTELRTRPTNPVNVVAVNNSWQGGDYSEALREAISRAVRAGILVVAAAGNGGRSNDGRAAYPANYETPEAGFDGVLSVAALDQQGYLTSTSQFGRRSVELGAPGDAILTTAPGDRYYAVDGTSLAAPFVTGAAARYALAKPGASALETRQAMLATVAPTPSIEKRTVTGGRLDMSAMLRHASAVQTSSAGGSGS